MKQINWGIIGCGDVTELKSGPAFNKVPGSALVAVMRRDAAKAADYAKRHGVSRWYSKAEDLINDLAVNAVYVATPPDSHAQFTLAALRAGKPVYVEKPMSVNYNTALSMAMEAENLQVKLVVAHYRRAWPLFIKLKYFIDEQTIGTIKTVNLVLSKLALTQEELATDKMAWRVNPAISGGGLFHDLAPHQLDIMYHLFGEALQVSGDAKNTGGLYDAPDLVSGTVQFSNNIHFSGEWNFNAATDEDHCEITGDRGMIRFSFFKGNSIELINDGQSSIFEFDYLQHVQQPMIEKTVQYFQGKSANPCTGREGALVMKWMEQITGGEY